MTPSEWVTFTVSGPPVAKSRARSGGQGRHYTPEHTRKYEAHTRLAAQIAMGERRPMKGAVEMLIVAVLPIRQFMVQTEADRGCGWYDLADDEAGHRQLSENHRRRLQRDRLRRRQPDSVRQGRKGFWRPAAHGCYRGGNSRNNLTYAALLLLVSAAM